MTFLKNRLEKKKLKFGEDEKVFPPEILAR